MIINEEGWLVNTHHVFSPNYEARKESEISLIVLHNISLPPFEYGQWAIDDLFTNQVKVDLDPFFCVIEKARVSSHLLLNRQGQWTQYVSFLDMAYHAGVSSFQGRSACNHFSIGIELEGCDFEPFTLAQYQALVPMLHLLCVHYGIGAITGHQHIAPDRKTDPGHFFDWNILKSASLPINFNQNND
ncbi:1,6-anhydro-N-acetylmuramyl-L-alanine amidase AmpD [Neisseria sp. Ec49-e6-T10]|uniref:1,6-anhydro-N-acetylmuramyl-L-alanine amidase AmpD n=1 Tax=Neisseria sp. Ec49-e6-T10 TaxID=3140744 RepID=UPI003EC056AA